MDETRKRYVIAGVLVGTVTVGLVVLARKTPRDQWGETLRRVATDALAFKSFTWELRGRTTRSGQTSRRLTMGS